MNTGKHPASLNCGRHAVSMKNERYHARMKNGRHPVCVDQEASFQHEEWKAPNSEK